MKRAAGLLLGMALLLSIGRADALILLSPLGANRVIAPEEYDHDIWVQWPPATNPAGSNRLRSLMTREDWRSGLEGLSFQQEGTGFRCSDTQALASTGYFQARKELLGSRPVMAVRNARGFTAVESLFLALDERGYVQPVSVHTKLPPNALVVYSAETWDDAMEVVNATPGRSIVIEYPTGEMLSAAWMFGPGLPNGIPTPKRTGVPGLIAAREVLTILEAPKSATWSPGRGGISGSARDWMLKVNLERPVYLAGLFALSACLACAALCSVGQQQGGLWARIGLGLVLLVLPAQVLAGNLVRIFGILDWNLLGPLSVLVLIFVLAPIHFGFRALWPKTHPLFPVALLNSLLLLALDPKWSVLSEVFRPDFQRISALGFGCLIASLTGLVAFSYRAELIPRLLTATALMGSMLLAIFHPLWWSPSPIFVLTVLAMATLSGAGEIRAFLLPAFMAAPIGLLPFPPRFSWRPSGLVDSYSQKGTVNLAAHMEFLLSPGFLATVLAVALAALLSGKFVRHQLQRSLLGNRPARSLMAACAATVTIGILIPEFLTSALIVFQASLLVWLFDAAGAA